MAKLKSELVYAVFSGVFLIAAADSGDCTVPLLNHGYFVKEQLGDFYFSWAALRYIRNVTYTKVTIGTVVPHNTSFIVFCHTGYSFQGIRAETRKVICTKGSWLPYPVCLLRTTFETNPTLATNAVKKILPEETADLNTESTTSAKDEPITSEDPKIFVDLLPYPEEGERFNKHTKGRCYSKDLRNTTNVDIDESPTVTASGHHFNAVCIKGFSPKHNSAYCLNGKWMQDCDSPCKESDCIVPFLDYGVFKTEQLGDPFFSREIGFIRKVTYKKITTGTAVPHGTSCIVNCGRRTSGVSEVTCTKGRWSRDPVCLLHIFCEPLNEGDLFKILYTNDKALNEDKMFETLQGDTHKRGNGVAIYSCKRQTQRLIGSRNRTCLHTGLWSGTEPVCEDLLTCQRFVTSTNLVVSYSDGVRVNSSASFRCKNDLILDGSSESTCLSNGSWSQPLPSCGIPTIPEDIPGCSITSLMMTIPENMVPDLTDVTDEFFTPGSEIPLQCADDLIFEGNPIATCGFSAKWKLENVQCVSGCRLSKNSPALIIEPAKDGYRFGESIFLSCPPGTALSNDVQRLVCLGKMWSDEMSTCTEQKK